MGPSCPICSECFRDSRRVSHHIGTVHDVPWQDEETLRRFHQRYGMSGRQIADVLGCSAATVPRWLNRYNIFTPVSLSTTPDKGYEKCRNGDDTVYVHRLLAVAEYGFDAVCDNIVHHKNGIPWDNRRENIEVMPQPKHHGEHKKVDGLERKAIAYAYEFTDMSSYEIAEGCDYTANSVLRIHREYFD